MTVNKYGSFDDVTPSSSPGRLNAKKTKDAISQGRTIVVTVDSLEYDLENEVGFVVSIDNLNDVKINLPDPNDHLGREVSITKATNLNSTDIYTDAGNIFFGGSSAGNISLSTMGEVVVFVAGFDYWYTKSHTT